MKASFLIIILAALILAASCDDNDGQTPIIPNQQDSIEVITDTISIEINCLLISGPPDDSTYKYEYVIRDDSSYNHELKYKCPAASLPNIDFDTHTLFGYKLQTNWWKIDSAFIRTVTRYNYLKKYLYHIQVTRKSIDDIGIGCMNWLLVPRIPDDFTVEFDTSYTIID